MAKRFFAVIGDPIAHSVSPLIHQLFSEQTGLTLSYKKIHGQEKDFEQQVKNFFASGGSGLNVTAPFKQKAFAMAKKKTARCQTAGAANTLWLRDGQLWADNTDGVGFIRDLSQYLNLSGKQVLLLGAGGAARGILGPLLESKPSRLILANRTLEKAQRIHQIFPEIEVCAFDNIQGNFDLLIHARPSILSSQEKRFLSACFSKKTFCYDLAYEPHGETAFVQYAKSQGCQAQQGLGMLVEQAAESFYIWHGIKPLTQTLIPLLRGYFFISP